MYTSLTGDKKFNLDLLVVLKKCKVYYYKLDIFTIINECINWICWVMFLVRQYPKDCSDIQENGMKYSGIYTIYPETQFSPKSIEVFCDFNTDGGHWTVGLFVYFMSWELL